MQLLLYSWMYDLYSVERSCNIEKILLVIIAFLCEIDKLREYKENLLDRLTKIT